MKQRREREKRTIGSHCLCPTAADGPLSRAALQCLFRGCSNALYRHVQAAQANYPRGKTAKCQLPTVLPRCLPSLGPLSLSLAALLLLPWPNPKPNLTLNSLSLSLSRITFLFLVHISIVLLHPFVASGGSTLVAVLACFPSRDWNPSDTKMFLPHDPHHCSPPF